MPKIKGKNIDKPVDGYVSGRNYALQELSNFGNFLHCLRGGFGDVF